MVEATTLFKPVKKAQEIYFFLAKTLRNLAINDLTRVRLRDITMSRSMNLTIAEGNKHKYLQPMTFFFIPLPSSRIQKTHGKRKQGHIQIR